jgi:hypothetical protein
MVRVELRTVRLRTRFFAADRAAFSLGKGFLLVRYWLL